MTYVTDFLTTKYLAENYLTNTDDIVDPTPEIKQAREKAKRDVGRQNYSIFFRGDVIAAGETHDLTLTEMAMLALVHDRSGRPDDSAEIAETSMQHAEIGMKLAEAREKFEYACNAVPKMCPERLPSPSKFQIPFLEKRYMEYGRKIACIKHRLENGAWYITPKNRQRFCDTVGIKKRQFQRVKAKLLQLGLIKIRPTDGNECDTRATGLVSNIPRVESEKKFFKVHSKFTIFGYFTEYDFNVPCSFIDKCYLSIMYQRMVSNGVKKEPCRKTTINPAYTPKRTVNRDVHYECLSYDVEAGENRFAQQTPPASLEMMPKIWWNSGIFPNSISFCVFFVLCTYYNQHRL